VWAGHTMRYAIASEISIETVIFTTPVGLHNKDFSVKNTFNMSLKKIEYFLNIRFVFNKINSTMGL
jgi:hypothetical protein